MIQDPLQHQFNYANASAPARRGLGGPRSMQGLSKVSRRIASEVPRRTAASSSNPSPADVQIEAAALKLINSPNTIFSKTPENIAECAFAMAQAEVQPLKSDFSASAASTKASFDMLNSSVETSRMRTEALLASADAQARIAQADNRRAQEKLQETLECVQKTTTQIQAKWRAAVCTGFGLFVTLMFRWIMPQHEPLLGVIATVIASLGTLSQFWPL